MSAGIIYIVDDDEAVRDSMRTLLESYDFNVRDFESGSDLLEDGGLSRCDCLLLDLHMPAMNGLELVEALRARGLATPAILITGKGDTLLAPRLAAAGVSVILYKPVSSDELFHAIETTMAG